MKHGFARLNIDGIWLVVHESGNVYMDDERGLEFCSAVGAVRKVAYPGRRGHRWVATTCDHVESTLMETRRESLRWLLAKRGVR